MREAGVKEKGALKTSRLQFIRRERLPKPDWIRVRAASPGSRFHEIKKILREQHLHTVCEEASCPNIAECFGKGTATFMILGDICTRRCPFCDVAHGRPLAPDLHEPRHLAQTIQKLKLSYVVITSVDRDDLKDGGAQHFVDCIRAVRETSPRTTIEVLVPDFRGRLERALERHPRLAQRVFTEGELAYAAERARPGRHLAARFAAKEAVVKALGRRGLGLREIEVVAGKPPTVRLSGASAEAAGGREVELSLTHSRETAAAVALIR